MKKSSEIVTRRLPRITESQRAGRSAVDFVKHIIHDELGSGFIEFPQQEDFGFDGLLHLFKDSSATGMTVRVQIKTGKSNVSIRRKDPNKVTLRVKSKHLNQWAEESNNPVLLIWVDSDAKPPKAVWGLFPECMVEGKVILNTHKCLRYNTVNELLLRLRPPLGRESGKLDGRPLVPKMGENLRKVAKSYYGMWRQDGSFSPCLGQIGISLRAWRNITAQSRKPEQVSHSLALLPIAKKIIETTKEVCNYRYPPPTEGKIGYQVARGFLTLERDVTFRFRAPGRVVVTVEEIIRYPSNPGAILRRDDFEKKHVLLNVYERGKSHHKERRLHQPAHQNNFEAGPLKGGGVLRPKPSTPLSRKRHSLPQI